jgi:hypothetical protein
MSNIGNYFSSFKVVDNSEDLTKKEDLEKPEEIEATETEIPEAIETETVEDTISSEIESTEDQTEEEESDSPIQSISTHFVEKGLFVPKKDKEYDASEDGLEDLIKDTLEAKFQEKINSLPEEVRQLVEYGQLGGNIDELQQINEELEIFYDIDLEDLDTSKNIYKDYLIANGFEEAEADEQVTLSENSGMLEGNAKLAQKYFIKATESKKTSIIDNKNKEVEKIESERIQKEKEFKNKVLNTKEIKGFSLSNKDAETLYDFITKPVDKTGRSKFVAEMTDEDKLAFAYLKMKGFSFKDIEKKIETKATLNLKKKLINFKDNNATAQTNRSSEIDVKKEKVEIPNIWNSFTSKK